MFCCLGFRIYVWGLEFLGFGSSRVFCISLVRDIIGVKYEV